MGPAAPDLDGELGIPARATLEVPSRLLEPARLLLIRSGDAPSGLATIPSSRGPRPDDGARPGSLSVRVSPGSSARGGARCIVVGRQASAADVRVDHGSVSRRHAALYYEGRPGGAALVVHDLGGKHGTYVDGSRLEKRGRVELPLRSGEHGIRFGNAPLVCRAIIVAAESSNERSLSPAPAKSSDEQSHPPTKSSAEKSRLSTKSNDGQSRPQHESVPGERTGQVQQGSPEQKVPDDPTENGGSEKACANSKMEPPDDMTSTRQTREAQIAAMIASLDSDPVYKKYVPDQEDDATEIRNENDKEGANENHDVKLHSDSTSNEHKLPITSSITLSPGSDSFTSSDGTNTPLQANASVSALCFEPSGARLVAGHRDGTLRFYDFHGMQTSTSSGSTLGTVTYPPFRVVDSDNDPLDHTGRHVVTALGQSPAGGQWIVGTTSAQPKVLDREGRATLFNFMKGDMYVTDSSATKGHTAGVTGVAFHPLAKDVCWTCGLDGSIRQWDLSGRGRIQFQKLLCQKVIGKCKNERGQRTQVASNLGVHPGGRKIVVGTSCGSIQIWNCFGSGVNSRPLGGVCSAHGGAKPVTFVAFSESGDRIASRSVSDDTVRIWNANQMEKGTGSFGRKFGGRRKEGEHPPSLLLAVCNGLPALNESANCAFGPAGRMLCAGSSVDPRSSGARGKIKFYQLPGEEKFKDRREIGAKSPSKGKTTLVLDPAEELSVAPNVSVLGVQWHPKLNQIALGTSNGTIQVLYDPYVSTKGALIPASRGVRQRDDLSDLLRSRAPTGSAAYLGSANSGIIVPNALPLFRDAPRATRKTKELDRKDPEKTRLPEPPVTGGIKTGGSSGTGISFTQHVVQSTNYVNNKNIAGKDPREELFKYSEGKSYVSKAYEGDVQRILADKTVEEEEADLKARKRHKTK